MNLTVLKDAISNLEKDYSIVCPKEVYSSGYYHQETLIFQGDKKTYADIVSFAIAVLSWMPCGGIDIKFRSLSGLESSELELMFSKKDVFDEDVNKVKKELEALLNMSNANVLSCYQISDDWNDMQYIFEYDDKYYLHQWYTAE